MVSSPVAFIRQSRIAAMMRRDKNIKERGQHAIIGKPLYYAYESRRRKLSLPVTADTTLAMEVSHLACVLTKKLTRTAQYETR